MVVEWWMCVCGEIRVCGWIVMGWVGWVGCGASGFDVDGDVVVDELGSVVGDEVVVDESETSWISALGTASSATCVPPAVNGPPITAFSWMVQWEPMLMGEWVELMCARGWIRVWADMVIGWGPRRRAPSAM
jgi:hypothetical protein